MGIAETAIKILPEVINDFFKNKNSIRTRFLLFSREFDPVLRKSDIREVLRVSIVRLITSEAINRVGVKNFRKTPIYNQAKLPVRSAVIELLKEKENLDKFENLIEERKKGLYARSRKLLNRFIKPK